MAERVEVWEQDCGCRELTRTEFTFSNGELVKATARDEYGPMVSTDKLECSDWYESAKRDGKRVL